MSSASRKAALGFNDPAVNLVLRKPGFQSSSIECGRLYCSSNLDALLRSYARLISWKYRWRLPHECHWLWTFLAFEILVLSFGAADRLARQKVKTLQRNALDVRIS
jgi:hypothetical protein